MYRRAEKKEYYNYKDMPPLPLTVIKIHIPELGLTVVDEVGVALAGVAGVSGS